MLHNGMTLAKRFLKPKSYIFILRLIPLLINLKCTKANNNSHRSVSDIESGVKLEELLQKHGSDKATMHDYWRVYEKVFAASQDGRGIILEVGMGTNNPLIPSNMGGYFTPGGSLRAWQAYFSNFEILGADIDREILFAEGRINTILWATVTGFLCTLAFNFILIKNFGIEGAAVSTSITFLGIFFFIYIALLIVGALPSKNLFILTPENTNDAKKQFKARRKGID